MNKLYTSLLLCLINVCLQAQQAPPASFKSIHEEQSNYYKNLGLNDAQYAAQYINTLTTAKQTSTQACTLKKKVYGWHPYWSAGAEANYQWDKLSHLVYFDYEVSTSTGNNINSSFAWSTSNAVTQALANNVKVHFCATMFSGHATFLGSTNAKQTFITNAINLLNARGGVGVNIDFEGMASSNKTAFTAFIQDLHTQLKAANSTYEVTIAMPSVDWGGVMDISNLNSSVELFCIMAYDYYYGSSANAGPTSPTYSLTTSYNQNISKSITYYLGQGAPKTKLICALPYYGREWSVTGTAAGAPTTSGSASVTYKALRVNASGNFNTKLWEKNCFSPYYNYSSKQCFIDDAFSFDRKLEVIEQMGIGGTGIWALGYDDGYTDLWSVLENRLTTCGVKKCTDSIFDGGGPTRNYYDKESYTYTISPAGASSVTIDFKTFGLENGNDTLAIYDGATLTSPLIGKYTGAASPGVITSTSPSITLRFKADNGVNNIGYKAVYTCVSDSVKPTTVITVPNVWESTSFTASYTDADVGTGVDKGLYNVSAHNGTEYRSNAVRGFINDEFNTTIHPSWTQKKGTWAIAGGTLTQTDVISNNTNIYTPIAQNISNKYLYNWKGKAQGTSSTRRAGLHIMCDIADSANRNNSYFMWARFDDNKLQFYKVQNNVFGTPVIDINYTFVAGQTYDYKILYDRILGDVKLFIDDKYVASWKDGTPIATGNSVSFRTGQCEYVIDDFRVYRSRGNTTNITVGNTTSDMVQFQNDNPSTPACKIRSVAIDLSNNWSSIVSKNVNIDWTKPNTITTVNDGSGADQANITTNTISTNYTASADVNSGITTYYYAIGTAPKLSNVHVYTLVGNSTSVSSAPLSLTNGTMYYISVYAVNGAGLISDTTVSNGFVYTGTTIIVGMAQITAQLNSLISAYPNPNNGTFVLTLPECVGYSYNVINTLGQTIQQANTSNYNTIIDLQQQPKGIYLLQIYNNDKLIKTQRVSVQQ
ncbi:MAG: T9SS type A sorting domain-containing protein [Bacteroidia bacterium]|nr:T9SS type A sorting domain-containing protein [Bacteroidia bacterium]